jgi:hypothetical protein
MAGEAAFSNSISYPELTLNYVNLACLALSKTRFPLGM